jgi:titin
VRLRLEALEDRRVLAPALVTSTSDDDVPGTLRYAIEQVNSGVASPVIDFDIGVGVQTIYVGFSTGLPLPALILPTLVDGTSEPGWAPEAPQIEINGIFAGNGVDGLELDAGGTVQGLDINSFGGSGIAFLSQGPGRVQQCFIGTDPTGSFGEGNNNGVQIGSASGTDNVSGVTVGGTQRDELNLISGNLTNGVIIYHGKNNLIRDNYIGTDLTGTYAISNGVGITLSTGSSNTIGGTVNLGDTDVTRNYIAGNRGDGIDLLGTNSNIIEGNFIGIGPDMNGTPAMGNSNGIGIAGDSTQNVIGGVVLATGNNVARNYIAGNNGAGINIAGSNATTIAGNWIGQSIDLQTNMELNVPNLSAGIVLSGAADTVIGGITLNGADNVSRNLISGNQGDGIDLINNTTGTQVLGNYIGTDQTGTLAASNGGNGVGITGGSNKNAIGGTVSEARNLISGNQKAGVFISDAGTMNNTVEGDYIGTDVTGTTALANAGNGVTIFDEASNNTIGGTILDSADQRTNVSRNIISGNKVFGVQIWEEAPTTNNLVQGNYIGTDVSGTMAVANLEGVGISYGASGNTVGGTLLGGAGGTIHLARNLISGNTKYGVGLFDRFTSDNMVIDNYIGTDPTGTVALPNGDGVAIYDAASSNHVGEIVKDMNGTHIYRNLISGNANSGVHLYDNDTTLNVVQANYIGTDLTGTVALPNGTGVSISGGAYGNIIGTVTDNLTQDQVLLAPNIISGNAKYGVALYDTNTDNNEIQGNYIGLDVTGTVALANPTGVIIYNGASNNVIGGTGLALDINKQTVFASRNYITGNTNDGVEIVGGILGLGDEPTGNMIEGNFIGLDTQGKPLANVFFGNGANGVNLFFNVANTVIGGTVLADVGGVLTNISGNYISANTLDGISISSNSTGTQILGNIIGLDPTNTAAMNGGNGVHVQDTSDGTIVGDPSTPGAGNTIWYNGGDGVLIDTAVNNSIRGNSTYGHDVAGPNLGIHLINGANNNMVYPMLFSVVDNGDGTTTIEWTYMDSTLPFTSIIFDFYASPTSNQSGFGEGYLYLGMFTETTDANGVVDELTTMGQVLSFVVPSGWYVSETATSVTMDANNNNLYNTSQFSQDFVVPGATFASLGSGIQSLPVQFIQATQGSSLQAVDSGRSVAGVWDQLANGSGRNAPPEHHGRDWVFAHVQNLSGLGLPGGHGLLETELGLGGNW